MNIALVGYGKMGQEVEQQALTRGHSITHQLGPDSDLSTIDFTGVDVAIEFTRPDAAVSNIESLIAQGVTTVTGTTAWEDQLPHIEQLVTEQGIGFLYSANFSIGVHLFRRVIEHAASLINSCPEYDVYAHECHHAQKADSPSGTALGIADILLQQLDRKETLVTETLNRPPLPEELHFTSTRGGSVPAVHTIFFDSPADTIEIRHSARNRSGFALGAVKAAEWLHGKTGFYTMSDFLSDSLSL